MLTDQQVLALERTLIKDNECITHIRLGSGTYGLGNTNTCGYSGTSDDRPLSAYDDAALGGRKRSSGVQIAAVVEDLLYLIVFSYGSERVIRLRPFETYSDGRGAAYDTNEVYTVTPISDTEHVIKTDLGEYKGSARRGVPEGRGVYTYDLPDPRISCDGFFEDGVPARYCKIKYRDGSYYEGWVKNGEFEDRGKLCYPDGSYYEGYFQGGMPHGSGVLYDKKGKVIHNGWWKAGEITK